MNYPKLNILQKRNQPSLREKLLAHVNSTDDFSQDVLDEATFIAATEFFKLLRYEPKQHAQIMGKIRRAAQRLALGKELDVISN